ncbi:uncharacterized protein Aud_000001 [Aspergillus udagawae]|uniref:Uncharacterized protein n=1 Tax=Aspergillus udagawae TaxID=91492 RepID=A0A8E0QHQ6_9EURO|nr:uncharacterized protein Aud_000001 [Aspergillus udagawae]GIC84187.1 hypothetical protein Aud_000001 [Aspergillus udagawae]
MPKRRADTVLESAPKLPCDCDQIAGRVHQEEYILENGFVTSTLCDSCVLSGEDCVMDQTRRYSKCASCTRQGRLCKKDFYTKKEWDLLKHAEKKIASELSVTDDELELLYPELQQLQEHLEKIQKELMEKQQKFLKERGFKISEHDAELLRILDEKKSSDQPNPAIEAQQLAATSDNPDFSQMVVEIDQMPPSFWENFDLSLSSIVE